MNRPAAVLALLATFAPALALAQNNAFTLVLAGKQVGKSTFTVKKTKKGFEMDDRTVYRISGQDADLSDQFEYAPDYKYVTGTTEDHNTLTQTSYVPSKIGDEVTVSHFQGGNHDTNPIPAKPDTIVLLPFDAGAAQMALLFIKNNPSKDNLYNVLIPSGAGGGGRGGGGGGRGGGGAPSGGDAGADSGATSLPGATDMLWVQGKDTDGTLDGKPVTLHTYEFAYSRLRIIMYADADNKLMLANVPALQATYIRNGFKLVPRSADASAAAPNKN